MQFSTTALISSLSATAFALPQTIARPGETSPWSVTQYTEGCSPGGCTYSFDISGPDTPEFGGAFSTHCSGTDVQNKQVNCTNTQFSANVKSETAGLILFVQRIYPFGTETDIAAGNVTVASPGTVPGSSFTIDARVFGQIIIN